MDDEMDVVERTLIIPATPNEVWLAVTDPGSVSDWFGAELLEWEPRAGGRVAFRDADGVVRRGVIETADEPSRLVIRWLAIEQLADGSMHATDPRVVIISLERAAEGTTLTVTDAAAALQR